MALLHWSAHCCSFVIVCRRCLLQVRPGRDAYAPASGCFAILTWPWRARDPSRRLAEGIVRPTRLRGGQPGAVWSRVRIPSVSSCYSSAHRAPMQAHHAMPSGHVMILQYVTEVGRRNPGSCFSNARGSMLQCEFVSERAGSSAGVLCGLSCLLSQE